MSPSEAVGAHQRHHQIAEKARRYGQAQDKVEHRGASDPGQRARGGQEDQKAARAKREIDDVGHGAIPLRFRYGPNLVPAPVRVPCAMRGSAVRIA